MTTRAHSVATASSGLGRRRLGLRVAALGVVLGATGVAATGPADATPASLAALRQRHPALAEAAHPVSAREEGAEVVGGVATIPRTRTARAAHVRMRRDGTSLRVDEPVSGAWVEVRNHLGAREPARIEGSFVHHPPVDRGAPALVRRLEAEGVEEFVVFERAPARREARFTITFGEAVKGLRLVERQLELIDVHGIPRLRMPAPWIEDARGARHDADVRVDGCAVDTDPRGPWGRPPVAPGAARCDVVISFPEVEYPAALDPAWTTTGSMGVARWSHAAIRLDDGDVLVIGGAADANAQAANKSAEIYDVQSGTFAATDSLTHNRHVRSVAKTNLGDVLVAGAEVTTLETAPDATTAELYDVSAGQWVATGALVTPRTVGFSLTTLVNGDVLLAGGNLASDGTATDLAEIYDTSANAFVTTGPLSATRQRHSGVRLASGEVMVFAGENTGTLGDETTATEIFDPANGTWSAGPMTQRAWEDYDYAVLSDGRILLVGDCYCTPSTLLTDLYDPSLGFWSSGPAALPQDELDSPSVVELTAGRALVTGGFNGGTLTQVSMLDAQSDMYAAAPMTLGRSKHSATLLSNGAVLVAGGQASASRTTSAELYAPLVDGEECTDALDCESGFCVAGVCCDSACTGTCEACTAADKASGPDGTCGPRPSGFACGTGSCSGSTRYLPATCDGFGTCDGTAFEYCAPYYCDTAADACASTCATDGDCQAGYECDDDDLCKAIEGYSCLVDADCLENVCIDEICCADPSCVPPLYCDTDDECPTGTACRFGECVIPPPAAGEDGGFLDGGDGCGCRIEGASPLPLRASLSLAALGALALAARRRRRTDR